MLMAVVILFVIVGLFFIVIKYKEMYRTSDEFEREKAISTAAKLADTAEFSCGEYLCVDTDKIMAMKERQAYKDFFPVESLSVIKINQEQNITECTEKNYPDCNFFKIYDSEKSNTETVSTFVSICRKETENNYWYQKCEIGKIVAGITPEGGENE